MFDFDAIQQSDTNAIQNLDIQKIEPFYYVEYFYNVEKKEVYVKFFTTRYRKSFSTIKKAEEYTDFDLPGMNCNCVYNYCCIETKPSVFYILKPNTEYDVKYYVGTTHKITCFKQLNVTFDSIENKFKVN